MSAIPSCRIYIVYRHALFAQGVRSVLESQPAVRIVGMDDDVARATSAIGAEQPDVILLEEPEDRGLDLASACTGPAPCERRSRPRRPPPSTSGRR
jgi:chemotaxis response regulator CheB